MGIDYQLSLTSLRHRTLSLLNKWSFTCEAIEYLVRHHSLYLLSEHISVLLVEVFMKCIILDALLCSSEEQRRRPVWDGDYKPCYLYHIIASRRGRRQRRRCLTSDRMTLYWNRRVCIYSLCDDFFSELTAILKRHNGLWINLPVPNIGTTLWPSPSLEILSRNADPRKGGPSPLCRWQSSALDLHSFTRLVIMNIMTRRTELVPVHRLFPSNPLSMSI